MNTKSRLTQICLLAVLLLLQPTSQAQPVVTKVAAGPNDTLFIKTDGSLWGMGADTYGELGDGSTGEKDSPEQILPGGVTAIAVGQYHSLFIKSDGSLWAMGYNDEGQLGDSTHGVNRLVPEQIVPTGVIAVAAGNYHSLFLKSDGSLWGMGDNSYAQLYNEPSGFVVTPVEIVTSGVRAVAAGGNHELFIKRPNFNSAQLWAMGDNTYGQLGDGNTNTLVFPNSPLELFSDNPTFSTFVTAIATGINHSLFIRSDGSLWGMGFNGDGELGDATVTKRLTSEQILPSGVSAIAVGDYHSLFLKSDGSLWAMGDNTYGELGAGPISNDGVGDYYGANSAIPLEAVPDNVTALAAGGGDSLFVQNDGSLWGMGENIFSLDYYPYSDVMPEEIVWPPPPPLGITTYSNQPVVVFPMTAAGYVLQMTTNLASGVWGAAPNGVTFIALQFTNAPPNAFFRLQPPQ